MYPFISRLSILVLIVFIAVTNVSAQSKIALVNSQLFQEQNGITKILTAGKQLENEFRPAYTELENMDKKHKELTNQLNNPATRTQAKYDEYEKLDRDMKSKTSDYQSRYNRRYNEVMNPIYDQVITVMKLWCQQKGYNSLVDVSKDEKGMFLYYDESLLKQTTEELIRFVNATLK